MHRISRPAGLPRGLRAAIAEDVNYAMHAVPVEPGEYTCVLSPTVAGVFAHESFGHKSESDFMLGSRRCAGSGSWASRSAGRA